MMKHFLIVIMLVLGSCVSMPKANAADSILDFLPAIIAGANKLPRAIDFSVKIPVLLSNREYRIELNRWDIPNNRTSPVQTTDNLQAAIDWAADEGYNRIILPEGTYLIGKYGNAIYQKGIVLHDNTELFMEDGAVLEMAANDKWNYCVLAITGKSNVIIRGGTIKGDRDTHIFTPRPSDDKTAHDEGHGICIQNGANRILVEEMNIKDLTGDGSLLVTEVSDVTFRNNTISNNRRQGISIVGGTRINIEDNEIHHIEGTSPQFGIDIEGAGRIDQDIIIRGNYFHHNRGGDIVSSTGRNVFILNNVMEQGEGSSYIDGPLVTWHKTDNVIYRNTITMTSGSVNGRLGYIQYSSGGDKGHDRVTYVHENICNGCGMYMYKSADADIRRNKFFGYFLSLNQFTNATVIDNAVTRLPGGPGYCWDYRMRSVTGTASGNTYEGNPYDLPLSYVPWTSPCLR